MAVKFLFIVLPGMDLSLQRWGKRPEDEFELFTVFMRTCMRDFASSKTVANILHGSSVSRLHNYTKSVTLLAFSMIPGPVDSQDE